MDSCRWQYILGHRKPGNLEDVNGKTGAVTIKDGPGTFVEPMSNAQAQQRIVFLDESQRVILA